MFWLKSWLYIISINLLNHGRLLFLTVILLLLLTPLPFSLPVDPSELLTPDPVELQCVPMETHFFPIPKLLVAAPMALNSVSLSRNPS